MGMINSNLAHNPKRINVKINRAICVNDIAVTVDMKKLNKYDEAKVEVISQLGQKTGEFFWPLDSLSMLLELNKDRRGLYFMTNCLPKYCFRCVGKCNHEL